MRIPLNLGCFLIPWSCSWLPEHSPLVLPLVVFVSIEPAYSCLQSLLAPSRKRLCVARMLQHPFAVFWRADGSGFIVLASEYSPFTRRAWGCNPTSWGCELLSLSCSYIGCRVSRWLCFSFAFFDFKFWWILKQRWPELLRINLSTVVRAHYLFSWLALRVFEVVPLVAVSAAWKIRPSEQIWSQFSGREVSELRGIMLPLMHMSVRWVSE